MPQEPSAAQIYGRDFPAGAVVFEEGDPGSRMYVIVSGSVRIEKRVGSRSLRLALLGPGEAFGEMALLEDASRSASAVVEQPARILEIDEAAFEDLVRNNGEVALRLLRRLSGGLVGPVPDPAAELLRARLHEGGRGDAELRDLAEYLELTRRFEQGERP
jgi:CRP-like cAMP-binding protein